MPDQFGDLPVPGTSGVSEVKPADILASYARFTQVGITVAKGNGLIAAGTVMAMVTATKKYAPYNNADSPAGVGTAKGILRQAIDTSDADHLGSLVVSGIVKYDKLVGRDSNADTDLNARIDVDNNLYVF